VCARTDALDVLIELIGPSYEVRLVQSNARCAVSALTSEPQGLVIGFWHP